MSNLELQGESTSSWMWTFQRIFSSSFLKPFSCIGILYMLVAWTGFNTILTYMIDILNDSGSTIEPDMGPMIVGGVRIIFASKCTKILFWIMHPTAPSWVCYPKEIII